MKAVRYDAPRSFTVADIPIPEAGPDEVRIKVSQVGVCGTDLHLHDGGFNAVFPLIPGHEVVGIVDQLGVRVTRFRLGEQVNGRLPVRRPAGPVGEQRHINRPGTRVPRVTREAKIFARLPQVAGN